jgi:hypothetical protein
MASESYTDPSPTVIFLALIESPPSRIIVCWLDSRVDEVEASEVLEALFGIVLDVLRGKYGIGIYARLLLPDI